MMIIADPTADRLMWLYGFRACQVVDLTRQEVFRVTGQAAHASKPDQVPLHQAHAAHLASSRAWPVITGDPPVWAGYDHLVFVQV